MDMSHELRENIQVEFYEAVPTVIHLMMDDYQRVWGDACNLNRFINAQERIL